MRASAFARICLHGYFRALLEKFYEEMYERSSFLLELFLSFLGLPILWPLVTSNGPEKRADAIARGRVTEHGGCDDEGVKK